MLAVLIAAVVALLIGLFGTPMLIKFLVRQGYGQFIRDDGPTTHHTKRGTPTMGGAVIILASVVSYAAAHLLTWTPPTMSAILVLFLMSGLGLVGFLDDYIKISKQRSLGLRSAEKLFGQVLVATVFAILALQFPSERWRTPASTQVSFVRDTGFDLAFAGPLLGVLLFVIWANVIVAGTSNGVNLTDGLDGLAIMPVIMVGSALGVFAYVTGSSVYSKYLLFPYIPGTGELLIFCAAMAGAGLAFLWYNAHPAQVFMGDVGALALGGALGTIAVIVRQEIVLAIMGGIFVAEAVSVMLQVTWFKYTKRRYGEGRRLLKMAPLHHHFEKSGWAETQVVVRFWIITMLLCLIGLSSLKLR